MKESDAGITQKKLFVHANGVTRFDKQTERRVFFILTLIMLVWGIVSKIGF